MLCLRVGQRPVCPRAKCPILNTRIEVQDLVESPEEIHGPVAGTVKPEAAAPSYAHFKPASEAASKAKRANRRDGGRAEEILRRSLWRLGLRFRKHVRSLPGQPDIVFPKGRTCVFVDGDFWHGREWTGLEQSLLHRANPGYWIPKIARNIERDREQTRMLRELGWEVIRVWETDTLADPASVAGRIRDELVGRRISLASRAGQRATYIQARTSMTITRDAEP